MPGNEKFKPCPFCEGTNIRSTAHPHAGRGEHAGETVYSMCCYDCGATFPNRYRRELLVEAWNRRPLAYEAAKAAPAGAVAWLRFTHKGFGCELSKHVAYALPEGVYAVYAHPAPASTAEDWRSLLSEMVNAMRRYEMDVDEPAPYRHRDMMDRADALLSTAPAPAGEE